MPRFLLGTHPQQKNKDNNDDDKHSNRLQLKDTVKTWWRRLRRKTSSSSASPKSATSSSSRDWRSLSPHEPPLPFVASSNTQRGIAPTLGRTTSSRRSRAAGIIPTFEVSLFSVLDEKGKARSGGEQYHRRGGGKTLVVAGKCILQLIYCSIPFCVFVYIFSTRGINCSAIFQTPPYFFPCLPPPCLRVTLSEIGVRGIG